MFWGVLGCFGVFWGVLGCFGVFSTGKMTKLRSETAQNSVRDGLFWAKRQEMSEIPFFLPRLVGV